jgi:hypothetical protein
LEVVAGPSKGKIIQLRPGQPITVGRASWADLPLPDDFLLSGRHFTLEYANETCYLRDLTSVTGTQLNGKKVVQAMVRVGDRIIAGQHTMVLRIERSASLTAAPAPLPTAVPPAPPADLEHFLRSQPQPLFALLDAAQEPKLVGWLYEFKVEYASLYEGQKGVEMQYVAPYLVRLPADSIFLGFLAKKGWGKNWGVYLTCDQSLQEVRQHLRHFLMVKLPNGKVVYFRFYDPRVLRVFLATLNEEQTSEFFGPLRSLLMEGEEPETLLRFTLDRQRVRQESVPVSVVEQEQSEAVRP